MPAAFGSSASGLVLVGTKVVTDSCAAPATAGATGEISRAAGDYEKAFAAYEARLRSFIEGKQRIAESFASTFVPQTELGIWLRNQATRLMALPGAAHLMVGKNLSDDFALPDYA